MESSPNEKAPESQEPESPEEFGDLDTGAEEESAVTAERMDNLFQTPLSEDTEAFKEMWTRVEGFLDDEEKWKNDPVVQNFKLTAERAIDPDTDEKPFDVIKDYLQEDSLEDAIRNSMLTSEGPIKHDVTTLYALGRVLNREFEGDSAGGSAALSELGKRIELAVKANAVATQEAKGKDASGIKREVEEQLAVGEQTGTMSEQFRGFIEDITTSTEKEVVTPPTPEVVEKEPLPVTPWKLGVEKENTPENTTRKRDLGILLLPSNTVLENPKQQAARQKAWDSITDSVFKGGKAYEGSVFMTMAERAGGVPKNTEGIDQVLKVLKEGGLSSIKNPAKLSLQELRELRLAGLLLLQNGYEGDKQKDFASMSKNEKLAVRSGELIGMVAEADIIRRMALSKKGLDRGRAEKAHKRYMQYVDNADIPDQFKKYFSQAEAFLRKKYDFVDTSGDKDRTYSVEKVSDLSPEQEKEKFLRDVSAWQMSNPNATFEDWKTSQKDNPEAIKSFQELAHELEDGSGKSETPEEVWGRLYGETLLQGQKAAEVLARKLQKWQETNPGSSLDAWREANPEDAAMLSHIAKATGTKDSDFWNILIGRPDLVNAPDQKTKAEELPSPTPEKSVAEKPTIPEKRPHIAESVDLLLAEKKLLNELENAQRDEGYRQKYPGYNQWKKDVRDTYKNDSTWKTFEAAAKRMNLTPELLWDRLKRGGQSSNAA